MDPIDSWVDAVEIRRLAESLVGVAPAATETPAVGFGERFVGFDKPVQERGAEAAAAVGQQARHALAGARELAERGGILQQSQGAASPRGVPSAATAPSAPAKSIAAPTRPPAEAPRPSAPSPPVRTESLSTPQGYLMERLTAYGQWLQRAVSAKAFFVADREGELLIDQIQSPKLLQVARTLAQASWTANRQAGARESVGSLHVKLGAGSVMEVLTVDSRYGPLILGVVVPGLLPVATVGVVAKSLEKAVNAPVQPS